MAKAPIRLDQHVDALVTAEISYEHDRAVGMGYRSVEEEVVRDEVRDVSASSRTATPLATSNEPEGASGSGCIAPILAAATATIRPPGISTSSPQIMSSQGPEVADSRSSNGVRAVLCQEVWSHGPISAAS